MKFACYNIGCKVNFAEISEINENLIEHGFELVSVEEEPELILIHSCTVTKHADAETRKTVRRAIRTHPDAFIIVFGCSAQINSEELANIEGLDLILGNEEKFSIIEYAGDFKKKNKAEIHVSGIDNCKFHSACSEDSEVHTRTAFKIQDGCNYFCSYCAVPYARGTSRSMDFNELKTKLLKFNNANVFEVVLSGINLGEYSSSNGEKFIDVLKFIADSELKYRVRISSLEPNLTTTEVINIVKNSNNFCPHFHIPMQSGSNEILSKMRRRYNAEYIKDLFARIKTEMPYSCIGVDVIAGFPNELPEHFEECHNLLDNSHISYLHVFTYSERAGTRASAFDGHIEKTIKKERTNILRTLSDKKTSDFYKTQLGTIQRVIPERYNPKTLLWNAWTDNYVRVEFKADPLLPLNFYNVRLAELCQGKELYVKSEVV